MMVIFVSKSEGKSIPVVRRILDSFALRIGTDTWKTVITEEGLATVRTLLRRSATKSTAVSCHWIRSRSRSELVWIVGKRSKFNEEGIVPVHYTSKNIVHSEWENDWQYLSLIKAIAALAALLHDWGKASDLFQHKLRAAGKGKLEADPFRHEWISCKLLEALVRYTDAYDDDKKWLTALAEGTINTKALAELAGKNMGTLGPMPPVASMLAWIILSHHRLPYIEDDNTRNGYQSDGVYSFQQMIERICSSWGYSRRCSNEDERKKEKQCFSFRQGLLWDDGLLWQKALKKWAAKMLREEAALCMLIREGNLAFRSIATYARLCLMLSDHYISSLPREGAGKSTHKKKHSWSPVELWANTDCNKELKQSLEEHVVSVMEQALQIAHQLPNFAAQMEKAEDIAFLKKQSPKSFRWQDRAVEKIKQFRQKERGKMAYFIVNMASTGCGKTIANAKLMNAVSEDGESLRYVLALGLRTLTLQTGDEYRTRIGLDKSELAVMIGSSVIQSLHEQDKMDEEDISSIGETEALMQEELDYDDTCSAEQTVFLDIFFQHNPQKYKAFLYKPVLTATIDYMMAATETVRGGKYMLPLLRLMSSDLVIDEIDDFDKKDLIAISRLVHLAGMMGRSVAISSATIPPDLAQGMFRAYMRGLACYNQFFTEAKQCGVVLCDEFKTVAGRIAMGDFQAYKVMHEAFVDKRVQHLEKQVIKRKGIIVDIPEAPDGGSRITQFFEAVKKAAISLHDDNYVMDKRTKKRVSFGLIRLANTSPCVACSLYLLSSECMLPNGYAIRVMTYHSRQILIMRHEQEKYLDAVLKRKYDSSVPVDIQDPVIRRHLDRIEEDNVLFIVVATPIEEIGRDHDFDWAVVEPSSYRSFIQLAGRVLRHRMVYADIIKPNIAVMQYNIKALQGKPQAFTKPGYEVKPYHLRSHDLHDIIDEGAFHKKIDAVLRIRKPVMNGTDKKDVSLLIDLEHMTMEDFNSAEPGPQGLSGWIDEYWWLTALPQTFNRFREGQADRKLIGVYRDGKIHFSMYEDGECIDCGDTLHIKQDTIEYGAERIWLPRTYEDALCRRIPEDDDLPEEELLETLSNKYGEITLPVDSGDETWFYDDQFGIFKKMR